MNAFMNEIERQRYRSLWRRRIITMALIVLVAISLFVMFKKYHLNFDEIPGGLNIYEKDGSFMYYDTKISEHITTTGNWNFIDRDLEKGILYLTTDTYFRMDNFSRLFKCNEQKTYRESVAGYGVNYSPDKNFNIQYDDNGNEHKCTWLLVARYYVDRNGERHRIWVRSGYEDMVEASENS